MFRSNNPLTSAAVAASSDVTDPHTGTSASSTSISFEDLPVEIFAHEIAPELSKTDLKALKATSRKCCLFVDTAYNAKEHKGQSLETYLANANARGARAIQAATATPDKKAADLLEQTARSDGTKVIRCNIFGDTSMCQQPQLAPNTLCTNLGISRTTVDNYEFFGLSMPSNIPKFYFSSLRRNILGKVAYSVSVVFCENENTMKNAMNMYQEYYNRLPGVVMIVVTHPTVNCDHDALNKAGFGQITLTAANFDADSFARAILTEIQNIKNAPEAAPAASSECLRM